MAGKTVSMEEISKEVTKMPMDHTKNIYQRMLMVQKELKTIAKNLNVPTSKTQSYKAVSEVDVLNAVKPLEEKYGIYSYPYEREIVESNQVIQKSQYGEKVNFFLRIKTVYRFVNVDDPKEFIDMVTYADGLDSGDKSTGKAMTYADKYALLKAYKISTGEDPDQNPSNEYEKVSKSKPTGKPVSDRKNDIGTLLLEFKECQRKLSDLGVDIHSENIKQWMANHTGYGDQQADIEDYDKMLKLVKAYKTLINAKEQASATQ